MAPEQPAPQATLLAVSTAKKLWAGFDADTDPVAIAGPLGFCVMLQVSEFGTAGSAFAHNDNPIPVIKLSEERVKVSAVLSDPETVGMPNPGLVASWSGPVLNKI